MGNVPFHRRLIRQITKNSSGTLSVSIPIEHASLLGLEKGQEVIIEREGNNLVVRPIQPRRRRG